MKIETSHGSEVNGYSSSDVARGLHDSAAGQVRVAAFLGGRAVGSARFRVHQYIPYLERQGIHIKEFVARFGSWPPPNRAWRPLWFPATLLDRMPSVLKSHGYDVALLQREMISTLVTLEQFTRRPRLLDVDDAVWLNMRSEETFATLAQMCDGVICGNSFLEESVRRWQSETMMLPTAVDTSRFCPLPASERHSPRPIVGWSGTGSGLKYLSRIEPALATVLSNHRDALLRVVCDRHPHFRTLDPSRVEYIRWSPENEVRTIQEMTIGLMPTEDTLWARGKCSYKMLLYMSCGVPVVVSPVGMNNEVLSLGCIGFGARNHAEWADCMSSLLDNPEKGREIGSTGRRIVERYYSLHTLAPRLGKYIRRFVH